MPYATLKPKPTPEELQILTKLSRSSTQQYRVVARAKAILMSIDGLPDKEIARILSFPSMAVGRWRRQFVKGGIQELFGQMLTKAKPKKLDKIKVFKKILKILPKEPPEGYSEWNSDSIATALKLPKYFIRRLLNKVYFH